MIFSLGDHSRFCADVRWERKEVGKAVEYGRDLWLPPAKPWIGKWRERKKAPILFEAFFAARATRCHPRYG
jgi:hypothetical protein